MLGVTPEDWHVLAAVAVGRRGTPAHLPEDLRAIESPNTRKPHDEIAFSLARWAAETGRGTPAADSS